MCTTSRPPASSRSNSPDNFETRHTSFARQAAFDAFGPKAAHHLNDNEFVDRPSDRPPKRLGEIVENVVAATARKAIRHWTKAAALAVTETEREEALEIAGKIARAAGLDWPEDWGEAA